MIDVTVIIPVYNVKKYLKKCLDELISQDYDKEKMELYIVDDCSTDGSTEIIKEYEKKYSFITAKYLSKNAGVSHARNIGIRNCKGDYIMFCDADDYYTSNAISKLMYYVKKYDADFITANYYIYKNNKSIKVNTSNYFSKDKITKQEIVSYMTLTSCSKLMKKEIFLNNNIFYPEEIKRCEELPVIPIVAYYANMPIAIDDALYYYVQRKSSASNKNTKTEDITYFDITFENFRENIDGSIYKEELEFRAIEHFLYSKTLVMLKSNMDKKLIVEHIMNFKKQYPNFIKNKYFKKFNKLKKIFIYSLNYKMLLLAKLFVKIHTKLTE